MLRGKMNGLIYCLLVYLQAGFRGKSRNPTVNINNKQCMLYISLSNFNNTRGASFCSAKY